MRKIEITYCSLWDYKPEAVSLAADLKEFGVNDLIKLVPGDKGIFKLTLDDKLIYSKTKSGDFPKLSEIADIARMINSWHLMLRS